MGATSPGKHELTLLLGLSSRWRAFVLRDEQWLKFRT
jgi:hypothetical protein